MLVTCYFLYACVFAMTRPCFVINLPIQVSVILSRYIKCTIHNAEKYFNRACSEKSFGVMGKHQETEPEI